jgi:hypothetical protein
LARLLYSSFAKEVGMNDLPLEMQRALEKSTREFERLLFLLGLSKNELARVANKIHSRRKAIPARPNKERRTEHGCL